MEKSIKDRFNDRILEQALQAYQIPANRVQALDGFESFIYAFDTQADSGILRISHAIRRSPDLIQGELDWINYLHLGGVAAARPLPSRNDQLVELIDDSAGSSFLAVAFEKAAGDHFRGTDWPAELLYEYGSQLGRMHRLSQAYRPRVPDWKRPEWDDPLMLDVDRFLPPEDLRIREIWEDLLAYLRSLSQGRTAYGLIHQDVHQGNFFISETGGITFFDFDDCVYSWYIYDIAMVLFYAVMGQKDQVEFTRKFLAGFLPGYFSENSLDPGWFQQIPHFLKLREIDLYAVIHRSFDLANLDDPWCIWYLDGRKERLDAGIPYLDFDFASLDWEQFI